MKSKFILILIIAGLSAQVGKAQEVAVKTNLLYDATLTVNLGAEIQIAPRWSVDLSGNFNAWSFSEGKRWKHWLVQPELRYWLCEPFGGHFFAFHAIGGQYNVGKLDLGDLNILGMNLSNLGTRRYQGWFGGLGLGYGYSWIISKHFNIEPEIGIGWMHTKFDVYPCARCGSKLSSDRHHNYLGVTKAAVNLVYVF